MITKVFSKFDLLSRLQSIFSSPLFLTREVIMLDIIIYTVYSAENVHH